MPDNSLTILKQRFDVEMLPDNDRFIHRMHVKSETSNRLYVVAQNKANGEWSCGCRGWIRHRHCKHLAPMLPVLKAVFAGGPSSKSTVKQLPSRRSR